MKGIYIFEKADCKGVGGCLISAVTEESFTPWSHNLVIHGHTEGDFVTSKCSKNDTYDFEVGALITMLKMCKTDAIVKAFYEVYKNEIEKDEAETSAKENGYEEKIRALENDNAELRRVIDDFNQDYSARGKVLEKLEKENEYAKKDVESIKALVNQFTKENKELEEKVKYHKNRADKVKKMINAMYGYVDTDMLICGGRTCGKQHIALVTLFKSLNQGTVDAAYKEAYNKESNGQPKLITKREQMWNDIKEGKITSVKVEKAFINNFLSEAEVNGLVWAIDAEKPTEYTKWVDWKNHEYIIFTIRDYVWSKHKQLRWGLTPNENTVDYLPPMRWDLFKKGRIIIGVRKEQHDEFVEESKRQFNKVIQHNPYESFNYSFFIYDKRVNYITPISKSQFRQAKTINGVKVVYWEDVK